MPLIRAQWDGERLEPLPRFRKECDKALVIPEIYTVEIQEPRSMASHRHYFAAVTEAWNNLPEDVGPDFPSSEHLRKYALIKTGFSRSKKLVLDTEREAKMVAAFIRPEDEFSVITVDDQVVTVYRAQSQSLKRIGGDGMDSDTFKKSKKAVLDFLSDMIGVRKSVLEDHTRTASWQA